MYHIAPSTTFANNCSDGVLRLEGGADSSEGRLEICINNAWGSVCDDQFGLADAGVACSQLDGLSRESERVILHCTGVY